MPVVRVRFKSANGKTREENVLVDCGAGTALIRKKFADFKKEKIDRLEMRKRQLKLFAKIRRLVFALQGKKDPA